MQSTTSKVVLIALVLLVGFLAYGFLTMPDQRSGTEKVGDAIHELPQGVDKASRQLEDRTPGQKIGDQIKDSTKPQ